MSALFIIGEISLQFDSCQLETKSNFRSSKRQWNEPKAKCLETERRCGSLLVTGSLALVRLNKDEKYTEKTSVGHG